MIKIDDFLKVELRTAKVISADSVGGSSKLLRLELSVGNKGGNDEWRQVVAGIGNKYDPEDLVGKIVILVANLEPKMIAGIESQGMVLAAVDDEGGISLLTTMENIKGGSRVS